MRKSYRREVVKMKKFSEGDLRINSEFKITIISDLKLFLISLLIVLILTVILAGGLIFGLKD